MRVLVTGGCGFIGSHIVDLLLEKGHQVIVVDNLSTGRKENLAHLTKPIEIVISDLADPKGDWVHAVSKSDAVIHLAALADIVPSIQYPDAYYRSNVTGTFNLLQASRHHGIRRFIYAASSSCYGLAATPTLESAPIQCEYPYALTKRIGEELVLHFAKVYQLPALSLRFFNVYGTRSRTSGTYGAMFGVFLAQKLAKKPFTIIGDGEQTRDFIYVTDIARAMVMALESSKTQEIYNVGAGRPVSINRIAELLGGERVYIPKRPGEPDSTHADIRKIKSELGWAPTIPIEEGVKKMLQAIDYWKAAPVWDPQSIQTASADWFKYLGKSEGHEKNNFI